MHVQVCLLCLVYLQVFAPVSSFSAVSAAVAHARSTPMHDAHNSCSDTAMNLLRVQHSTSYNLPRGCGSQFTQKSATELHGQEQVC